MKIENNKKDLSKYINTLVLLRVMAIISPVIAGFVIASVSSTSICRMDAWNTTWNDESGYYHTIVVMREYGLPQGISGYNEVRSPLPSYGPYNYVTYLPYYVLSFLTGYKSHNFMVYANVLMMVFAHLFAVMALKPGKMQCMALIGFTLTHWICARYTWSGMSECTAMAAAMVIMSCVIYGFEYGDEAAKRSTAAGKAVFITELSVIYMAGLIRPFLLAFLIFPIMEVVLNREKRKRKILKISLIAGGALGGLAFYFWMADNVCSKYFSEGNTAFSGIIDSLADGRLLLTLKIITQCNFQALGTIRSIVLERGWTGVIILETASLFLILLAAAMGSRKRDKKNFLVSCSFLAVILLIYEANILMYTPYQFHRMLLCVVTSGTLLCIMRFGSIIRTVSQLSVVCATMMTVTLGGGAQYGLPQKNEVIASEHGAGDELQQIMPYNEERGWENTIASPPYSDGLYLTYAYPSYLSGNCCSEEYLYNAITNHSLKSRYVMIKDGDGDLAELCGKELEMIYSNYGYRIYRR